MERLTGTDKGWHKGVNCLLILPEVMEGGRGPGAYRSPGVALTGFPKTFFISNKVSELV